MAVHNILGSEGEKLARAYLEENGYQVIETNWRSGRKEIDIIARKDRLIVVVEVKTRTSDTFKLPEESVTQTKQRMLIEAADTYLQQLDFDAEVRYDIVTIIKTPSDIRIKHIQDAFIPLLD